VSRSAAIFDLDRTLLAGSSSSAISDALFEGGLTPRRAIPGQALMMQRYRLLGESAPSMFLARASALTARGKRVEDVSKAAELAADQLERDILPYVPPLLESHRKEGRALVLATTTPYDLVKPLADRLGFDDVIATRWATFTDSKGGIRYTGRLDGGFVWAMGKLRAVRRWAAEQGVSLATSWAYSDSFYDLPLLESVGYPHAVNPDYRLHAAATLQRWPVLHLDAPPGVPKVLGAEPLDLVRLLSPPLAFPYARFDIGGRENIPRRGPAIVAINHRSYFDVVAVTLAVVGAGRKPRGLAKRELFDAPLVGTVFRSAGAICVDRSRAGARAYEEAEDALGAGELLVIAPQGTIPRGEAFFEPQLVGKTGAARLAAATGAPVIPLGLWGTERVWPRSSRVPNVINVLSPPRVRVRVGPPVSGLSGTDPVADTAKIMDAIVDLLPPEARLARIASAEELTRAKPPA
jgi:putative phosphoserine phosphatase/1-acylglycerol-3-phosphate O-acyltransferase